MEQDAQISPPLTARLPQARFALCAVLGACLMLPGCAALRNATRPMAGPSFHPENVYRIDERMPIHIRRVAVLPLSVEEGDWKAADGRTHMEPTLHDELGKTRAFELIAISQAQLESWTGSRAWRASDRLPEELFDRLRNDLGCDAVLFTHLSPFHPYQPLVVGWNLRLVDTLSHSVLWAAEEVFDAAEVAVGNSARRFYRSQSGHERSYGDADRILLSPRRFGHYTLSALFETMPRR